MAGEDDRDRVAAVRRADRPHGRGPADPVRLLAVGAGLAVGDLGERLPGCELERGAVEVEREVERRARAGEVLVELAAVASSTGASPGVSVSPRETDAVEAAVGPDHGAQPCVACDEGQRADGAFVGGRDEMCHVR